MSNDIKNLMRLGCEKCGRKLFSIWTNKESINPTKVYMICTNCKHVLEITDGFD